MDISFYGKNCFRISERNHTTVVTDPHKPAKGAPPLDLPADLVTISHDRKQHDETQVAQHRYVIDGAGEYEVGELFVRGIPLHLHDPEKDQVLLNIAYHFEYPNQLNVLHLGKLREAPDEAVLEQFGVVNVLLLPVSPRGGLADEQLSDLVSLIEPAFVVPMVQAEKQSAHDSAVEQFIKAMGKEAEIRDSLRVTQNSLDDSTRLVVLRSSAPLG